MKRATSSSLPILSSIYFVSGVRALVVHIDEKIIRLESEKYNQSFNFSPSDFMIELGKGEIRLIQETAFNLQLQALGHMTQEQKVAHEKRLHYVKYFYEHCGPSLPRKGFEQLRANAASLISDPNPPCYSQLIKYCKRYWAANRSETALINQHQIGYQRCRRLQDELWSIINATIDEVYLKPERSSASFVHRLIKGKVIQYNRTFGPSKTLKEPCLNTVIAAIDRVDMLHRVSRREGPWIARRLNKGGIPVQFEERIGARVEADSQRMDVFTWNEHFNVVLQPHLTILLDVATRCVIGWDISFQNPSALKTILAVKHAITEAPFCETKVVPERLIMDNGKEFANKNLNGLTQDIQVISTYASPKSPNQKPFVERAFRTFNDQFFHNLPGTKKSNPAQRGDYESENSACISLEDLRRLFHRYITEVYHETRHSELGCSPLTKWRDLALDVPPRTLTKEETDFKCLIRVQCAINNGRVTFANMQWRGSGLTTLKEQLDSTQKKLKVTLLLNPDHVGAAWVEDPRGLIPLQEVQSCLPDRFHSMSLGEMEMIFDYQKQKHGRKEAEHTASLDQAALRLYQDINETAKKGKRTRQVKQMAKVEQAKSDYKEPIGQSLFSDDLAVQSQLTALNIKNLPNLTKEDGDSKSSTDGPSSQVQFDLDNDLFGTI